MQPTSLRSFISVIWKHTRPRICWSPSYLSVKYFAPVMRAIIFSLLSVLCFVNVWHVSPLGGAVWNYSKHKWVLYNLILLIVHMGSNPKVTLFFSTVNIFKIIRLKQTDNIIQYFLQQARAMMKAQRIISLPSQTLNF